MLQDLFVLGFWVTLAAVVFSFGLTLILYLIAGIVAAVGWVWEKLTGKDL